MLELLLILKLVQSRLVVLGRLIESHSEIFLLFFKAGLLGQMRLVFLLNIDLKGSVLLMRRLEIKLKFLFI